MRAIFQAAAPLYHHMLKLVFTIPSPLVHPHPPPGAELSSTHLDAGRLTCHVPWRKDGDAPPAHAGCQNVTDGPVTRLFELQSQIHRGDWSTAHRPLAMLKNDDGWYPAFDTQRASKRCSRASQLTLPNDWPAALQHLTFCRLEPAGHVRFVPLPNASPPPPSLARTPPQLASPPTRERRQRRTTASWDSRWKWVHVSDARLQSLPLAAIVYCAAKYLAPRVHDKEKEVMHHPSPPKNPTNPSHTVQMPGV